MTRTTANLVLLGTAAIWGLAFVFQKTAMDHMGPYLFVALRSFIACAALLPVALSERPGGAPLLPGGLVRVASLGGAMFFLGALLQQIGLVTATVTNTGFLTGLYVVITPLLVWVFFRRAPVRHVWLAVGLAFVGTWFLGGGTVGGLSYGDVLVAVSALFWAGHMLVIEASSHHGRPIMFTCIQFAVTGVLGLAGAFAFETVSLSAIASAWQE
ncbi:MAG: DMT family transporter, partial [Pseudomonadota bacterium]